MHMDELETFLTLVQEKNFTKTAEKRALSQPTVSVHIKNLEREFATIFIKRTTKHVSLTMEGELFYEKALQIREIYQELQHTLYNKKQEVSGLIRFGASFTIGEYLLPKMIADWHNRYPLLDFHIMIGNTESIMASVRKLEVDIGLVEGTIHARDIRQTSFQKDRLVIVCSVNYRKKVTKIDELHDHVWIMREEGSGTRQSFDTFIKTRGIRVKDSFVFSSTQAIKSSVMNGMGLALLSETTIQEELKYGTLKILFSDVLYEMRSFSSIVTKVPSNGHNIQLLLQDLHKRS
ncbi:LysR family transcriptional regulator [Alkalihalobacillus pseudalcaliphilus]|uniref:LysR family transcriptional regulator n=1 Tax=Alkalihalobacillus pseudalcaliphilus TaxID=79884 RepID=UPI00064E12DC|nr:LysR family transcriptional regulator [Alkalihalobacillus pseudalcaliphilus]KMK75197.1 transcriptional regulator [Alkalihalobacillus pseudalcaliphilus]